MQGFYHGIAVGSNMSNLTLDQVTSHEHGDINSFQSETAAFYVAAGISLNGLTVTDSHFDSSAYGVYQQKASGDGSSVTNVNISVKER